MPQKRKIKSKKKNKKATKVKVLRSKAKKIKVLKKKNKKIPASAKKERYYLNESFDFFSELRALILKASPSEKEILVKKISKIGRVKLAIISGVFLADRSNGTVISEPIADLFVVADDVSRAKLNSFLKSLEAQIGREIKFSLMEKDEFQYRLGMFDRFVRVLLEGPHEKIINRLGV